jgi:hypothetical protein
MVQPGTARHQEEIGHFVIQQYKTEMSLGEA